MNKILSTSCLLAISLLLTSTANAHFLWLVANKDKQQSSQVELFFSEIAEADDPAILSRVQNVKLQSVSQAGKIADHQLIFADESLAAKIKHLQPQAAFILNHTYGVITRGKSTFVLNYYAKTYTPGTSQWKAVPTSKLLKLDIVPVKQADKHLFHVHWKGKPLAGAEITIYGDELENTIETTTDNSGIYTCKLPEKGIYSIRVKYVEATPGKLKGEQYDEVRHYSTLALNFAAKPVQQSISKTTPKRLQLKPIQTYPQLPVPISSFGAAVSNEYLYVYSGHTGGAHQHSRDNLSQHFQRLNVKDGKEWESLPMRTPLQGIAMVADNNNVYRIGGMSALNKKGDDGDLHSVSEFEAYNPKVKQWLTLPALPQGRSSHDAVILNNKIYVAGGWELRGNLDAVWHENALVFDLTNRKAGWQKFKQPFKRRALSLAAHQNKFYVLGGITEGGEMSHNVDIYDPNTKEWTKGPELPGSKMNGFGSTAWSLDGKLTFNGMDGEVYQMNVKKQQWNVTGKLKSPRFFHRLLPAGNGNFLVIAGASRKGHLQTVEAIPVSALQEESNN